MKRLHANLTVGDLAELAETFGRMRAAEAASFREDGPVTCCYARSDKAWVRDPGGVAWEAFFTHGESTVYGDGTGEALGTASNAAVSACCAPGTATP